MDGMELKSITCGVNETDRRLDRVVRKNFPSMPLSLIQKSIRTGKVRVNSSPSVLGYRLQKDDVITIPYSIIPRRIERQQVPNGPDPERPNILLENDHLIFVNKAAGVLVHGNNSLQHSILAYLNLKPGEGASFTPGPLHRLDRNTSGVICFGKTAPGARYYTQQLQEGSIGKFYLALVEGAVTEQELWRDRLERDRDKKVTRIAGGTGGKEAVAEMQPLLYTRGKSLLHIRLHTGFTHQIRAQCAVRGHPLTGDRKYGGPVAKKGEGYLLHAYALSFQNTGEFIPSRTITAPLPSSQVETIRTIFGDGAADSLKDVTGSILGQ